MKNSWYSMKEVAKEIGCSYRTVQRLIKNGKLGCVSVGRLNKITPEDLMEYRSKFGKTNTLLNPENTDLEEGKINGK